MAAHARVVWRFKREFLRQREIFTNINVQIWTLEPFLKFASLRLISYRAKMSGDRRGTIPHFISCYEYRDFGEGNVVESRYFLLNWFSFTPSVAYRHGVFFGYGKDRES